jgi:glycosyltransferase involved in cell wall biosynthesis
MKKLLFISYFFPPIHSVESTVALNAVKYLADYGWQPLVVASKDSRELGVDKKTEHLVPLDLKIARTASWENLLTRILNRLNLVTDALVGWFPFALSASLKLCRTEPVEAVISRANPITSHLVASRLIRQCKPKLPWVVMFGDPWTQNPYARPVNRWVQKWRGGIERRIINEASAVIVTTKLTKQLMVGKYGCAEKFHILPNTYDPAEFDSLLLGQDHSASHQLSITYTGTLYGLRSPEPLFQALAIIRDQHSDIASSLRVNLIGSMPQFLSRVAEYQLEDIVKCAGLLPREDALNQLANSQVLLLIDASSIVPSIFLPAKLVEYLAFHKPILAITPPGTSADLIAATNTGIVVDPGDITGLAQAIIHYYRLHQANQLQIQPNFEEINLYSATHYAEQLAKILNGLVSQ